MEFYIFQRKKPQRETFWEWWNYWISSKGIKWHLLIWRECLVGQLVQGSQVILLMGLVFQQVVGRKGMSSNGGKMRNSRSES